jgi:hypothetical protein
VFPGDGNGGFSQGQQIPLDGTIPELLFGGPRRRLLLRDLNRDGNLDLVALVSDASGAHAEVLLGNGNGGFTPSGDIDATENPSELALADMNHDGNLDLVVAGGTPRGVSVLLGDGKGGFGAPRHASIPNGDLQDFVVADFNRDGSPDVFVAGSSTRGWFLPGDGHGNLGTPIAVPNAPSGRLVAGDFNNDGRIDVAGESETQLDHMRVLLGTGDGTFQTPNDFPAIPNQLLGWSVILQDNVAARLFNDGKLSLVSITHTDTGSGAFDNVTVQRNTTR